MKAAMFTSHQRDILRHRIERAVLWRGASQADREYATRTANVVLDELETSGFSAAAQRRGVEKIVASLDEPVPLRSTSPAKRDVTAALDNAGLGSGTGS
jgi:hypothetical protein